LYVTDPHTYLESPEGGVCAFTVNLDGSTDPNKGGVWRVCGYPEALHSWEMYDQYMRECRKTGELPFTEAIRAEVFGVPGMTPQPPAEEGEGRVAEEKPKRQELVRAADIAQYERPPMPDEARKGPVVTLLDAPNDPLGTLAAIVGIYTGQVYRSKAEVTNEARRAALADMQQTVLNGPLEAVQFTFLVEGVSRSITHQMVRNRFSFFAQESLRFAVADDWAQEVPLPPSAAQDPEGPLAGIYRKAMNQSEDNYNALIGAGMPAEEARDVLAHGITTRLHWVVDLRTLITEAGKRTCTQAQFPWRQIFAGVAKALRARAHEWHAYNWANPGVQSFGYNQPDGWQYEALAELLRPVCYQTGKCGFMAKFDRGCTIRERVDANEKLGRPSSEWGQGWTPPDNEAGPGIAPIWPEEWAADPAAARVMEKNAQEPCDTCSGYGCAECEPAVE
jgi:flavin-dependent thymidylate synthase